MRFEWMECHREMYNDSCNQAHFDKMNNRDPTLNPYQQEYWYRVTLGWRISDDRYKFGEPKYLDAFESFAYSTQFSFTALVIASGALMATVI